jgi:sugar lactone lactonase YvrE
LRLSPAVAVVAAHLRQPDRPSPSSRPSPANTESRTAQGNGKTATFNYPTGIAATRWPGAEDDSKIILYIADNNNHKLRYQALGLPGEPVGTAMGNAIDREPTGYSFDGGPLDAQLRNPTALALGRVDSGSVLFLTEDFRGITGYTGKVRKLTDHPQNSHRELLSIAGSSSNGVYRDGIGIEAAFSTPAGIVANPRTDELFVTDAINNVIRKIQGNAQNGGVVSTFVGLAGSPGNVDGAAAIARFNRPGGIAMDAEENLYVIDGFVVRKVTPVGFVSTYAGSGKRGYKDGSASTAEFGDLAGIAADEYGNVYVSESSNATIRRITPGGLVTTIAGISGVFGAADGAPNTATFTTPSGLCYYNKQLFVTDVEAQTIRRIR